jgi:hypothetical protein
LIVIAILLAVVGLAFAGIGCAMIVDSGDKLDKAAGFGLLLFAAACAWGAYAFV